MAWHWQWGPGRAGPFSALSQGADSRERLGCAVTGSFGALLALSGMGHCCGVVTLLQSVGCNLNRPKSASIYIQAGYYRDQPEPE